MQTVNTLEALRQIISQVKSEGKRVGFVPTMGNLHQGHLSLIDIAKSNADFVICSIFVNPTQFGEGEDFDDYPRTLSQDQDKLKAKQCDLVFAPGVKEMYPGGFDKSLLSQVIVPGISDKHCGASRPGHFTGVATVVSKLFNMVTPDIAIFGEKDFQQLAVIKKFTSELAFPVKIIGAPTTREDSGLAMSSRNQYLSSDEKKQASVIYQTLTDTKTRILQSSESTLELQKEAILKLEQNGFRNDFFAICDSNTLETANESTVDFVILVAAFLSNTRLIDNVYFSKP